MAQDPGIRLLRFGVAVLLFVHGLYRATTGGVSGFGEFLSGQGFPAGGLLAWGLTLFELVGAPLLAFGIGVVPLALLFSAELATGILLVHRHAGWFVVGGGRNGVEYSLCLILALTACVLSERRGRASASAASRS
jgi:putative oxidoreductase